MLKAMTKEVERECWTQENVYNYGIGKLKD